MTSRTKGHETHDDAKKHTLILAHLFSISSSEISDPHLICPQRHIGFPFFIVISTFELVAVAMGRWGIGYGGSGKV